MRMTVAQYRQELDKLKAKPKARKYRNVPTMFGGLRFDSKREASRYAELSILERIGRIENLRIQVAYELAPAVKIAGAKRTKPAMRFIADFDYVENGVKVVEDVKSPTTASTAAFRAKLHLMKSVHGIDVKVVY